MHTLSSNFNHPNIVKVLGVCVENDPILIIMELMPAGDLLKFLRDAKRDHVSPYPDRNHALLFLAVAH